MVWKGPQNDIQGCKSIEKKLFSKASKYFQMSFPALTDSIPIVRTSFFSPRRTCSKSNHLALRVWKFFRRNKVSGTKLKNIGSIFERSGYE